MTLSRQLSSRLEDQVPQLAKVCVESLSQAKILLKHGQQIAGSLSTSCDGVRQYIMALKDCRHDLSLDDGWMIIIKIRTSSYQWLRKHQLVELNQVLFVVVYLCFTLD